MNGELVGQACTSKSTDGDGANREKRHYRWAEILPRHWLSTANNAGLSATVEEDIADLVAKTPEVIRAVSAILPDNFPRELVETIFDGLSGSAKKLSNPG